MRRDDLTRSQARAIKNKLGPMVSYLNRLCKRMSSRGFPADDPARLLVTAALKLIFELHADMECRSMDGRGLRDNAKPLTIDEQLARRSALRKHEKYRLGRPRRDAH